MSRPFKMKGPTFFNKKSPLKNAALANAKASDINFEIGEKRKASAKAQWKEAQRTRGGKNFFQKLMTPKPDKSKYDEAYDI